MACFLVHIACNVFFPECDVDRLPVVTDDVLELQ